MWRFALIGFIVLLDLITKFFAVQRLPDNGGRLRFPIDLALYKNYGVAFDLPIPLWIVVPLTIVVLVLFVREMRRSRENDRKTVAYALIVSGALGNLIDRVIYGYTVDYIILFGRSAINLADVMIVMGVATLIVSSRPKNQTTADKRIF